LVESFRLVDANMTIRIDTDGQVNVMVGGDRPFATIAPAREPSATPAQTQVQPTPPAPSSQPPKSDKPGDFSLLVRLVIFDDEFPGVGGVQRILAELHGDCAEFHIDLFETLLARGVEFRAVTAARQ